MSTKFGYALHPKETEKFCARCIRVAFALRNTHRAAHGNKPLRGVINLQWRQTRDAGSGAREREGMEGLMYWETGKLSCVLHRVMKSPHCPILQREMESGMAPFMWACAYAAVGAHAFTLVCGQMCAGRCVCVGDRDSSCVCARATHVPLNGNVCVCLFK